MVAVLIVVYHNYNKDSIELQQIDDTIKQLLHAIDDILQWDDEHDIGIILGLDE